MLSRKERWLTRLRWAALPILMLGLGMSMTGCIPVVSVGISTGWGNWWVPTTVNIIIPIIINISF
jgi:hypothetical protein